MLRIALPVVLFACFALLAFAARAQQAEFHDDFSNPKSGWPVRDKETDINVGLSFYTADGEYQMTPTADGVMGFSPAPFRATGGNVKLWATAWMYAGVGGGAAGVACRYTDGARFYAFIVLGDGHWNIIKGAPGRIERLASGEVKRRGAIPGMVEARMEADCDGDALRLRIDGEPAGEVRDGAYVDGASGLVVLGEKAAGTNATFDDFVLKSLP